MASQCRSGRSERACVSRKSVRLPRGIGGMGPGSFAGMPADVPFFRPGSPGPPLLAVSGLPWDKENRTLYDRSGQHRVHRPLGAVGGARVCSRKSP
jgi:hypothetical protein